MKKIKIRFVKRTYILCKQEVVDYLIQSKTWFGWRYMTYNECGGFGDSITTLYCKDNKEDLLEKVIDEVYKTDKAHVRVIEYPMLKIY